MSIPLRDAGTFTAHMDSLKTDLTNLSGPLVLVAPAPCPQGGRLRLNVPRGYQNRAARPEFELRTGGVQSTVTKIVI